VTLNSEKMMYFSGNLKICCMLIQNQNNLSSLPVTTLINLLQIDKWESKLWSMH